MKTQPSAHRERNPWLIRGVVGCVIVLAFMCATPAAFFLGGIVGQQQLYESWRERKIDKLSPIVQAEEFKGVNVEHSSAAQVYLTGTVGDQETHDKLREQLTSAFGSDEAHEMVWRVDVENPPLAEVDDDNDQVDVNP